MRLWVSWNGTIRHNQPTLSLHTQGKTPTEIQLELRQLGVKGFVVKVAGSRVTMKVSECDIKGTGSVSDERRS